MWFPQLQAPTGASLLPAARGHRSTGPRSARKHPRPPPALTPPCLRSAADEYLQMRALLSYVGDLVLPSAGRSCEGGVSKVLASVQQPRPPPHYRISPSLSSAVCLCRSAWPGQPLQRDTTRPCARLFRSSNRHIRRSIPTYLSLSISLSLSLQLWRPLIGATLPSWARGRRSALPAAPAAAPAAAPDDASALSEASSSSSQVRRQLEHSVLFTKGVLRKLLRQEIVHATALSSQGVRARLDALLGSDGLDLDELRGYQGKLALTLDAQRSVLDRSKVSIDSLMLQSLQLAYAQLPERCLLAFLGQTRPHDDPLLLTRCILLPPYRIGTWLRLRAKTPKDAGCWRASSSASAHGGGATCCA